MLYVQKNSVSIRELQQNLKRVMARVERGQVIEVTRRHRPVARLALVRATAPVSPWPDLDARAHIEPGDVQRVEGISVTTPSRAIRDAHTSHLGPALVRQSIEDGRRSGQLTFDEADRLERELLGTKSRPRKTSRWSRRGSAA
jgi:antitoxin (DNA-binding transcriptional repressor) of toxin-antitoxin stability system